jgi:glutathione S-transferase
MSIKLEFIVHPLCPYAQRSLYTLAYKGIEAEIIHVDVKKKEPWFLEINPLGQVPSLRVTKDGQVFNLAESLNISEYFDSFPGPSLYPRNPDGTVNSLEKGLIDVFIKLHFSDLVPSFYGALMKGDPESLEKYKSLLNRVNDLLENGNYVTNRILGRNELSFADVMLYPFIERYVVLKDLTPTAWEEANTGNIVTWFEKLSQEPWIQAHRAPEHRLHNLVSLSKSGNPGLVLPLSVYD